MSVSSSIKMFCFPYAGGNARSIYGDWEEEMLFDVDVIPIDLPGRGVNIDTDLPSDLHKVASEIMSEIYPLLTGEYVFYGHSVGALVSFEVARYLKKYHQTEPNALFVSAFRAPHTTGSRDPVHIMDDETLLSHVELLGGVPSHILHESELLILSLPVLRADLCLSETYKLSDIGSLSCPIYVYGGDRDPIVHRDDFTRWSELTTNTCEIKILKGGHFFHKVSQPDLFEDIYQKMRCVRVENQISVAR